MTKRILRYDRQWLEYPYEGYEGEKRLQEMANQEGLILLPVRFTDKKDGLPTILSDPETLRDEFAKAALQSCYVSRAESYCEAVVICYKIADAMIEARKKK